MMVMLLHMPYSLSTFARKIVEIILEMLHSLFFRLDNSSNAFVNVKVAPDKW